MARSRSTTPTDVELEILQVIWSLKSATVRDVYDELSKKRKISQNNVSTMMQLMAKKKLLTVVDDRRPSKYSATSKPDATRNAVLAHLAQRLFGGSASRMIMHLFNSRKTTPQQRKQVEKLLEELE